MKVFHLAVIRPQDRETAQPPTVILAAASKLDSFSMFSRGSAEEVMKFFAATVAERTAVGQRQVVTENEYVAHVIRRHQQLAVVAVTDKEYPEMVAMELATKVAREFEDRFSEAQIARATAPLPFEPVTTYLASYQDPQQANTILRVQKELEDTKAVLHQTMEGLLDRNERLDMLVDKSTHLSTQSKAFLKTAKKTNSCCIVM
ncbi:palmitoyltransferase [Coemansia nantahalensis]|uniref:Palmitoyltransferase n=1 Tax=Coemansia nantahalensis TaxID=2789366 RepID=A0ACC1K485_9FUNG|nr:palmitoyltransferase [Coemansia nantahalensis]KAJ2772709.1 palmitoyltransferase [Coemansia nantahalensis]